MNHQTVSVPHYRKQAQKMRKLAADETEDVRNELLRLAEDYDHIALSAAERTTDATRKIEDTKAPSSSVLARTPHVIII